MTILEIPKNIDDALEFECDPTTGECLTEEQVIELCMALELERDEKLAYITRKIINEDAEADALNDYYTKLGKRIKAKRAKVERLKKFVGYALNGEKWKSPDGLTSVIYRTTKDVVKIDELASIPDEYFKTPHTESNLSKVAIKDAIYAGNQVAGVHLENSTSVIVKG